MKKRTIRILTDEPVMWHQHPPHAEGDTSGQAPFTPSGHVIAQIRGETMDVYQNENSGAISVDPSGAILLALNEGSQFEFIDRL